MRGIAARGLKGRTAVETRDRKERGAARENGGRRGKGRKESLGEAGGESTRKETQMGESESR